MIDYVSIISTVGFPIFVATYMMFRLEKTIKSNTTALTELRLDLAKRNKK